MKIPSYASARIRRPAPANCCVLNESTPVVAFGDCQTATVATLGLNPSQWEFRDESGELVGDARRLASRTSLAGLSRDDAERQVWEDCKTYFHRNQCDWFDKLEVVLRACGASYKTNACHLDLVQWATKPKWSELERSVKEQLLDDGRECLDDQLRSKRLQLLLVNGRGAMKWLSADLQMVDRFDGLAYQSTALFQGALGHVRVIGWSTNLQSSRGVKKDLRALTRRVAALATGVGG